MALRSGVNVQFVTFDAGRGYGHKHLHKSPDLIPVIRLFTIYVISFLHYISACSKCLAMLHTDVIYITD